MGSYYKNRVMVSKRVGKDGYIENIDFDDLERIKKVFIEETQKIGIFDEDIETIKELLDGDKLLSDKCEKNIVLWSECFSNIIELQTKIYLEFTFKYINFKDIYNELNNRLKKYYILDVISYENYSSTSPNLIMVRNKHSEEMSKYLPMKDILLDISKDETISDEIIKRIVSSNDIDIIKSSVRNKNISDETLDLILNQKVS